MTPNTPAGGAVAGYVDGSRIDELRQGRLNIALWSQPIGCSQTPLYTTPPATVSADAVLALVALVARVRREADAHAYFAENGDLRMTTGDHERRAKNLAGIADELEALTREATK